MLKEGIIRKWALKSRSSFLMWYQCTYVCITFTDIQLYYICWCATTQKMENETEYVSPTQKHLLHSPVCSEKLCYVNCNTRINERCAFEEDVFQNLNNVCNRT